MERTNGAASGREQARAALVKAEGVVELLERAFELMSEDDPVQPAVEHLYAALYEAKTRLGVLEDWYWRTYGDQPSPAETESNRLESQGVRT